MTATSLVVFTRNDPADRPGALTKCVDSGTFKNNGNGDNTTCDITLQMLR